MRFNSDSIVRCAVLAATAGVFICTGPIRDRLPLLKTSSGIPAFADEESVSPCSPRPGVEYYYRTRLFGNPNVDIGERMRYAARTLRAGGQGMLKSPWTTVWTAAGPGNIAGRIRALAFDPGDSSIVYAGSASGGIFKSTNGGLSWRPTMDDAPSLPIGALAVDPRNPRVVFAGTGEPIVPLSKAITIPAFTGTGVLKSTDGGDSWSVLPWSGRPGAVTGIQLNPVSSDTMLVATRENLYKTTNGGQDWQANALTGVVTDVRYNTGDPSIVYAAIGSDFGYPSNGVYRSRAGGNRYTWTKISSNFPDPDSCGRIILAVTPADIRLIFAFVARPIDARVVPGGVQYSVFDNDFLALMRSTDEGDTWERLPTTLPSDFTLGQAFYNFTCAVSPTDPRLLFAGGLDMYRSRDGGLNFTRVSFGGQTMHLDQHAIAFRPGSPAVYVGNDGGVSRTTNDGNDWEFLGTTLETIQFYSVASDPKNPERIFGGTQDNGTLRRVLQSKNWMIIRGDVDGGFVAVDSNFIFAMGTLSIYPNRSSNGGQTWSAMNAGFMDGNRPNWLQPLILHPVDLNRLFTATQFVYECRDAQKTAGNPTWSAISPDLTTSSTVYESVISTLAVAPSNGEWMYAGTGDGKIQRCENLNSATPVWTDASLGIPRRWVTRIAVRPDNHLVAYATVSGYGAGHVFKTTNGGGQWLNISGNLPDLPANAVIVSPSQPNAVFVATDFGVWYTTNDAVWQRLGTGLPNVVVYDLTIDALNRIVAATHGRGMWVADATVDAGPPESAASFLTVRHYPDPLAASKPHLTVALTNPVPQTIRIDLYDVNGKSLRRLFEGDLARGTREMRFDLSNLRPGMYFYRIVGGRESITKKFLLLR
jgi:photosystem II stability/assembly factor-like uncharacterized protein